MTTMTTAAGTTAYRQTVQAFCRCLVMDTRSHDGSRFWRMDQACSDWREEFQAIARELHDGELPNDWRWAEIERISRELLELLQEAELGGDENALPTELADEISCEPDPYRSELLSWLDIGDRWEAREPSEIEPTANVYSLVQQLQTQERDWMARELAWQLERLTDVSSGS
jgi:hypothetical protein